MRTDYAIKIPYVMGIIATRSTDKQVTGLHDLMKEHEVRIRNGMVAYSELENSVLVIVTRSYCIICEKSKRLRLWSVIEKIYTKCC
jgi:cytochrome bd-type quinol oxidase subunit 1